MVGPGVGGLVVGFGGEVMLKFARMVPAEGLWSMPGPIAGGEDETLSEVFRVWCGVEMGTAAFSALEVAAGMACASVTPATVGDGAGPVLAGSGCRWDISLISTGVLEGRVSVCCCSFSRISS